MSRPPTILYVDPDPSSRRETGSAFNHAGLQMRTLPDPRHTLAGVRVLSPQLVLLHAEIRSEVTSSVLDQLAKDATAAQLPLVLLAEDVGDLRFIRQLRTGIVAVLQKPFQPHRHIQEIHALLGELSSRSGTATGSGDSAELAALVDHLRRTQRSGVMVLNARTPEEGRALFSRGVLRSAEHLGATGKEALVSMVGTPRAKWSFSEVGGSDHEVLIDLPSATGDAPMAAPAPAVPSEEEPVLEPLSGEVMIEVGELRGGEEEIPIAASARGRKGEGHGQGSTSILLVDDDETLCRMFGILFRKHGFLVETAPDGFAGYEAALRGTYELIVADLNMPRMDGWGMLKLLRDDFRTRELPVAFLSCHDDYRDTLRALDAGAQAYFSKATRLDALAEQVRALLLPRQQMRRALGTSSTRPVPVNVGKVGVQWLIGEIARAQLTGALDVRDGWAVYRLVFRAGLPVHALAQAGRHSAEGPKAFNALIASRGAEGTFTTGKADGPTTLEGDAHALLAAARRLLNENEQRLRDGLLVNAGELQIDRDLYALYARVGPRQWLETARLICEERLPPREVIAQVEASPLEVEETMKDLIRRGVIRLSA